MKYLGRIFQAQVKGTSIDGEVIHEHLYDVLDKYKKYGSHTALKNGRTIT